MTMIRRVVKQRSDHELITIELWNGAQVVGRKLPTQPDVHAQVVSMSATGPASGAAQSAAGRLLSGKFQHLVVQHLPEQTFSSWSLGTT